MIEVPCALCGSEDRRTLHDVAGWKEPLRIVRCRACDHVYRSPRPDDDAVDAYYDEDYYRGGGEPGDFRYEDERESEARVRTRARWRLRRMERVLGRPGRLLEVGCSFGLFLYEARRRGWQPVGADVSSVAVEHARDVLGLRVHHGRVETLDEPEGSFAAAYLSETIEHLADPLSSLRRLAALLEEGGLLVSGTGNVCSVAARVRGAGWGYYMPGHLQYFSIRSLRRALEASGFSRVKFYVPDDRGWRGTLACAPSEGRGRLAAILGRLARRPRIGDLAVGAGMVAYARKGSS